MSGASCAVLDHARIRSVPRERLDAAVYADHAFIIWIVLRSIGANRLVCIDKDCEIATPISR